ncbi:MAG: twin-arginine translocase TatA/TatE family subunit [Candidatus Thermoplasmatota archaeon]|jgi:sec-independent protein translocase protein TatA|nr:twin-arginine translocase TatA/TatE family subunit [Candidatus Thermoplasmatota archaeon]MCL5680859.1 twin-arginine translocase TatA/TatE family subunit [Candidatus Thermoplasmatota archaeon]
MLGSPTDWLILILVVLLVLGGSKKIPEIARSMGRAMGEFKRGQLEIEKELKGIGEKETKEEKKTN